MKTGCRCTACFPCPARLEVSRLITDEYFSRHVGADGLNTTSRILVSHRRRRPRPSWWSPCSIGKTVLHAFHMRHVTDEQAKKGLRQDKGRSGKAREVVMKLRRDLCWSCGTPLAPVTIRWAVTYPYASQLSSAARAASGRHQSGARS